LDTVVAMIDALCSGTLVDKPASRTSKKSQPFATCKVRCATRDGNALFVSVIAFASQAVQTLLALDAGDTAALSGELSVAVWRDRDGEPRPQLQLLAHAVMSLYAVSRRRAAVRDAAAEPVPSAATDCVAAEPSEPTADDEDLDDDLPF
jgi:single-stranded DNA-binding protein